MNEEKDTSQEDKRDWLDMHSDKILELEKRIEVLEKTTAGTMAGGKAVAEMYEVRNLISCPRTLGGSPNHQQLYEQVQL